MSPSSKEEIVIQGTAASPGVVQGPAFVFLQKDLEVPFYHVGEGRGLAEIKRFAQALEETRSQINTIKSEIASKLGEEEAQIFAAHLLVLEDKALIDETIQEQRKSGYNIEYCFHAVAKRYIDFFDQIEDDYLKERSMDIKDVVRRVLHNLMGHAGFTLKHLEDKRVVVAENLTPSDTAIIDKENVLALLTDLGSRTSHAVIVARTIQVPAVVGLHDITKRVKNADYLLVDGYDGTVIVHPSKETLARYGKIQSAHESLQRVYEECIPLPSQSADGKHLPLMANIEGEGDIPSVKRAGANGVGLFRTENLFLNKDTPPGEEEQFEVYREVAEALKPETVIIRTLDLGGDKSLFFKDGPLLEKETNPFMGFRAIRFCLEHKDLFKDQLRAILRASVFGEVKLMYPMISGVDELMKANALLEEAKAELRERSESFNEDLPVGVMIELPSAAYTADLLADHCAFFSIGTNDLIQYMMAVDRVNDKVAHLYDPNHPAVLRAIKAIIEAGKRKGIEVSICGEMAGDALYTALLFGLGADALSATPGYLAEMKYLLRKTKMEEAVHLAEQVLQQKRSKDVYQLLKNFYSAQLGELIEPEMGKP